MAKMVTVPRVRDTASALLLISGVTHVAQLFVYPENVSARGASLFGVIYFALGLFLRFSRGNAAVWLSAILPAIGGVLGVWRFIHLHRNPFSVFHVAIDLIVVPCCMYLLARREKRADD